MNLKCAAVGSCFVALTAYLAVGGGGMTQAAPRAPELVGSQWLNTPEGKPISLQSRLGKVTVVHFWTFECINCRHNLPAYARLQKKFEKLGVQFFGIHTPELETEKDPNNVAKAIKELGIAFPVLIDGQADNWKRWSVHYWPTVYVLDKQGRVQFTWEGELNWNGATGESQVANVIESLLKSGN